MGIISAPPGCGVTSLTEGRRALPLRWMESRERAAFYFEPIACFSLALGVDFPSAFPEGWSSGFSLIKEGIAVSYSYFF